MNTVITIAVAETADTRVTPGSRGASDNPASSFHCVLRQAARGKNEATCNSQAKAEHKAHKGERDGSLPRRAVDGDTFPSGGQDDGASRKLPLAHQSSGACGGTEGLEKPRPAGGKTKGGKRSASINGELPASAAFSMAGQGQPGIAAGAGQTANGFTETGTPHRYVDAGVVKTPSAATETGDGSSVAGGGSAGPTQGRSVSPLNAQTNPPPTLAMQQKSDHVPVVPANLTHDRTEPTATPVNTTRRIEVGIAADHRKEMGGVKKISPPIDEKPSAIQRSFSDGVPGMTGRVMPSQAAESATTGHVKFEQSLPGFPAVAGQTGQNQPQAAISPLGGLAIGMASGLENPAIAKLPTAPSPASQIGERLQEVVRTVGHLGVHAVNLRLEPSSLGEVHARLVKSEAVLQVVLQATQPQTQSLLTDHAHVLADHLSSAAGMPVQVDIGGYGAAQRDDTNAGGAFAERFQGRSPAQNVPSAMNAPAGDQESRTYGPGAGAGGLSIWI